MPSAPPMLAKTLPILRTTLEAVIRIPARVFGSRNQRLLKQYSHAVESINALEAGLAALSDEALRARTEELRKRHAEGATLDELLPDAFAVVREASKRTLRMRHFDVQLLGGMVLHNGKIAEMKTGEGKTLVATLPAYLNALTGKGVHIVTVNDYLAKRDAEWMGKIFHFLGLTVGVNLPHMDPEDKRKAYAADITYGTNNEFGFDYLRDNMAMHVEERYQRGLHYAIVDEVDSILIDEARTPLIISGQAEDHTDLYYRMNEVAPLLARQAEEDGPGDFSMDEKSRQVLLTESGHEHAEQLLARVGLLPEGRSLYEPSFINLMHHLYAALRAHHLFLRDTHYVVQEGEVIIVDEFTGRLMSGRRWSDGLHQAVEAKENVSIQNENQTLATITFQNYFRMYAKLAGMTGTADTEAYEFQEIYGLETLVVPTHQPMIRDDREDLVYQTINEKNDAIVAAIKHCYEHDQPVLVGTTSIENSELLSGMLDKDKLPHQVLNAKQHAREAEIVVQAGQPKMVTIATNMAGRGTDIVLGGNVERSVDVLRAAEDVDQTEKERRIQALREEWQLLHAKVIAAGGLHIIGTERHESRRIDNQLRGRAGRQGDPGSSRFYVSFEDDLMRRFAPDWLPGMLGKLGMTEDLPIESGWVTKALENAQTKVEGHNFDIRKHVVEYDDVMNVHRDVIYTERNKVLEGADMRANVFGMVEEELRELVAVHLPGRSEEAWDLELMLEEARGVFPLPPDVTVESLHGLGAEEIEALLLDEAEAAYAEREQQMGAENMRLLERLLVLQTVDRLWVEHLTAMDEMRQGIGLQAYGQQDPLVAYKREAHDMWGQLLANIRHTIARAIFHVNLAGQAPVAPRVPVGAVAASQAMPAGRQALRENRPDQAALPAARVAGKKVGRNDPCPCGSGRKYKKCHGVAA